MRGAEQATSPDVPITMHEADDSETPIYKMDVLVARLVFSVCVYIGKDEDPRLC